MATKESELSLIVLAHGSGEFEATPSATEVLALKTLKLLSIPQNY